MVLEAFVCLLLIGIVLIQRSKGQGVGLSFGGGAEAIFGAQMGNVLTRATVVLGIIFLVNTMILAVIPRSASAVSDSIAIQTAPKNVAAPASAAAPLSAEDAASALKVTDGDEFIVPGAAVPAEEATATEEAAPVVDEAAPVADEAAPVADETAPVATEEAAAPAPEPATDEAPAE